MDTPFANKYAIAPNTREYDETILKKFSALVKWPNASRTTEVIVSSIGFSMYRYYVSQLHTER